MRKPNRKIKSRKFDEPNYFLLAYEGNNSLWRYCLGVLLIWIIWFLISIYASWLIVKLMDFAGIMTSKAPYYLFIVKAIQNCFSTIGVFLVLKWLHRRKLSSVFGVKRKLSIRRILLATIVSSIIFSALFLYSQSSDAVLLNTFGLKKWSWLPAIVLFTIVQSAGEEFIFRGYLFQGFYFFTHKKLLAILFSSIAFACIHFTYLIFISPEEIGLFIFYFVFGIICCVITIRDKGVELAIGFHAGWNVLQFMMQGISKYLT